MKKYTLLLFIVIGMIPNKLKSQAFGDAFLGQILYVSFNYAPKNWAECNGQLMNISQNPALFSLLGTTYGGDGINTFALPKIQSRVLISDNTTHPLGQYGGEEAHTLTISEMPAHTHFVNATTTPGNNNSPTNQLPADTKVLDKEYADITIGNLNTMNGETVGNAGGSQPHPNMQPYITFKCIIALQGIYPSVN
ncbi:MAG: tail fiber protein [Weeksellaceae bacterium]|nr:tail fiber protein [Weeksellaceae bacterium]